MEEGDSKSIFQNKVIQEFAYYQRKILNNLGYVAISRQCVDINQSGDYTLKSSSGIAQLTFNVTVANSIIKGAHIFYLFYDKFADLEFLDRVSVVLYILIFGIMLISYSIWFLRYPLYEIAYRSWAVENSIYKRLGEPENLKKTIDTKLKATVWIHLAISWIGCFCLIISYYSFPKYYIFTYASLETEGAILCVIFGLHEFIFMMHAWCLMTSSNCLFTFRGIVLANLIDGMTSILDQISPHQGESKMLEGSKMMRDKSHKRNTKSKCLKYQNVEQILADYTKLSLIIEEYNKWVSYKTVFLHICGYCQFISDVFLAVQILRIPGFGILDIWFYIEDSLASMYMIWRVYEYMSRVEPASRNFFEALKTFLRYLPKTRRTKHVMKIMKTMKLVSLKIGPCPVKRSTVLSAIEILGNYYICVALW